MVTSNSVYANASTVPDVSNCLARWFSIERTARSLRCFWDIVLWRKFLIRFVTALRTKLTDFIGRSWQQGGGKQNSKCHGDWIMLRKCSLVSSNLNQLLTAYVYCSYGFHNLVNEIKYHIYSYIHYTVNFTWKNNVWHILGPTVLGQCELHTTEA